MQTILRAVNAALTTYMILLFIRILLTWFNAPSMGRPVELLKVITDPYLNYFRRFRFLQIGRMDFSPLLAFIVLGLLRNTVSAIANHQKISVGFVLALVLSGLWAAFSFFLILCCILTALRLIMYLVGANSQGPYTRTVDSLAQPLAEWVRRRLFRGRFIPSHKMMGITVIFFIAVAVAGNLLITILTGYLIHLPF